MSVRIEPDAHVGRGKGLAWVLAALGALLVAAALTLPGVHLDGHATVRDATPWRGPSVPGRASTDHSTHHSATAAAVHRSTSVVAGRPLRLTIPALGISAPVAPITVRSAVLVPPSDPQVLGWWSGGALPGARHGTALITGHTVHTGGGTFDDLHGLARGDRIGLATKTGHLEYRVDAVSDYSKPWLAAHAQKLFSQRVPGRLALVTCTDWTGTVYLSNTVVLATPVGR